MSNTIDFTPSWKSVAEIYLMVLDNPKASQQSRKDAKEEILRMADLADAYVKHKKDQDALLREIAEG